MDPQSQTAGQVSRFFPQLCLVQILGLTAAGLVLGFAGLDLGVDAATAVVLYAAFAAMGIVDPLIMRYVVIPSMRRQDTEAARNNAITIGFSSAAAGGFYALFAGLAEGRGWPAIPMGAIALYTWTFIWMYTREWTEVSPPPTEADSTWSG
jgi:hypothetical protein